MTAGIFALTGLVALIAALVLAGLGWVVSMPDSAHRFTYRLWAWICGAAFFACSFAASDHRWWWRWVLTAGSLTYCASKIQHWWRRVELVRRFEREVARGTLRKLS